MSRKDICNSCYFKDKMDQPLNNYKCYSENSGKLLHGKNTKTENKQINQCKTSLRSLYLCKELNISESTQLVMLEDIELIESHAHDRKLFFLMRP